MGAVIWQKGKAREGKSQDEAQGSIKVSAGKGQLGRSLPCSVWMGLCECLHSGVFAILSCISHSVISTMKNIAKRCSVTTEHPS